MEGGKTTTIIMRPRFELILPVLSRSLSEDVADVDDFLLCSADEDKFEMQSCSEPCSPDSGFSSDDGSLEPLKTRCRIERAKTLPSALRRSRSKQSEKRVRFADTLGLDLEKLQYFVKEENPALSFAARTIAPLELPPSFLGEGSSQLISSASSACRLVLSNFNYRSEHEYNDKTRLARVCVVALRASGSTVVGQVNLLNVAFDKTVTIRYTTNKWETQEEVVAGFSHRMFGTEDIDAFNFSIVLPNKLKAGRCEFCVQYAVSGEQFWDNNDGANYVVDVIEDPVPCSKLSPTTATPIFAASYPGGYRRSAGDGSTLPPLPQRQSPRRFRRWGRATVESDDENAGPVFYRATL
ncbi:unnamed protein product [Caenorhabditis auriculariae]|uniref:CBM21 domain-containing protein n=1 Tax=Caenorhabditis auriculariae TaxID=2777116 RepID=A0A8S1HUQ5_9PELO|nr:unnamed protein product [Caenorhabditis auriculariae]